MNRGVYLAFFRLPRTQTIEIGRLGCWRFAAGVYVYVGSAQRNLQARLGRHARRHKTRRWHIDYVSVRADFLGALMIDAPKSRECQLAGMLAKRYPRAAAGFGASDCRCGGHLFRVEGGGAGGKSAGGRRPGERGG